jgi:signal transduction histidine kinase
VVERIVAAGREAHQAVLQGRMTPDLAALYRQRLGELNDELARYQTGFIASFGEMARGLRLLLIGANLFLAIALVSLGVWLVRFEAMRARRAEGQLRADRERMLDSRATFLSKVSHELRSPLQGIVSSLDLIKLKHRRAFQGDEELFSSVRRSSMQLGTQLRDLLTLANGEAGRLELRPDPFDARELVATLAEGARPSAVEKGLAITADLPPEPVQVVGDAARMDQVLHNLVSNSIRYTSTGSIAVRLQLEHAISDAPAALRITVTDTGDGIPPADVPTLVTPDLAPQTSRSREGSGIGLAIVRTLLTLMKGRVDVRSKLGQGSAFEVVIPVEVTPSVEPSQPAEEGATEPCRRVLIVDDRPEVLEGITNVLRELGLDCDQATNARLARALLETNRYAVVLVDLELPDASGVELLGFTRASPNRDAYVVVMSATDKPLAVTSRFDAWLQKPVGHDVLRRVVAGKAGATERAPA